MIITGYWLEQANSLFKLLRKEILGGFIMKTLSDLKNNTETIFDIAKDKELTPSEINLLLVINLLSDNDKEVCFASNKTLAQKVNLSASRVTYILKDLAQKGLIILSYAPQGQVLNINGKDYVNYRLIKLNLPLIADNETPSLQTMTNKTKNKSTKNKSTKYLSSKTMDRQGKDKIKDKTKTTVKRDNTHSEMYQYAMQLIQERKDIGNKVKYALVMVKNWKKNGIQSVEELKNNRQPVSNKVFIEKVPEYITNKQPEIKQASQETLQDIDRLMAKLCN